VPDNFYVITAQMLLKATGKEEFYTLVSTDLTAGESVSGLCHIKCHETQLNFGQECKDHM